MGITQGILSTAFDVAKEHHGTRINEIRISVGDLTEIQDFALQFAFETLRQDTIAAEATLVVNHISPKSVCHQCGHEFQHDKWDLTCPDCGGLICEVVEGRELRIDSVDMETEAGIEELT